MAQFPDVNYDDIAPNYDQRSETDYLSGIVSALQDLAHQVNARRALDLGCGTGRSLQGLDSSLQPSPVCYGLDSSAGMLTQARCLDHNYRLVQASAVSPPFVPSSFDLVFCVHAFHHFPNKPQVVNSAYTTLRPGGAFAIVNMDPRECRNDYYVYDYFEGTYETDLDRFPSVAEQEAMLRRAGFQQVKSPVVHRIEDHLSGEAVFDSYFLRKDACSQLILLSDKAYQAGLARIRLKIAEGESRGEDVVFRTHLKNRMCYGFKPS